MKTEKYTKQPYRLTIAQYASDIHLERVIMRIIEVLQPSMRHCTKLLPSLLFNNRTIYLKSNLLLPKGSRNHQCIWKTLDKLRELKIQLKGKDQMGDYELITGFILSYKKYNNGQQLAIQMSDEVLKFVLNLEKGYTRYLRSVAFASSSSYTSRLYRWISHWRDKQDGFLINVSVVNLREMLGFAQKYDKPGSILQRILNPAARELKEKADISFDIQGAIKEGRKTIGWTISLYKKETQCKKEPILLPQPHETPRNAENLMPFPKVVSDDDLAAAKSSFLALVSKKVHNPVSNFAANFVQQNNDDSE